MTTSRPRVCILSLAPVHQDGRVFREIAYAARDYEVTVVGWGRLDRPRSHVTMVPVEPYRFGPLSRLVQVGLTVGGRFHPALWERWYWRKPDHRQTLALLTAEHFDLIHVNEMIALPIAIAAARHSGAKILFDAHEYSSTQETDKLWGRLLAVPMHRYLIRTYAPRADAMTTVAPGLAERYGREFGLQVSVVRNVPLYSAQPYRAAEPDHIRLVHHGMAMRDRLLERGIETLAQLDARFTLDFMLVPKDPGYLEQLAALAKRVAPGRVSFLPPAPPDQIAATVNRFDIGLPLIPPSSFSYLHALPNKFFEFIMAGLAVAVGPSPEMARVVREHGLGLVAPGFAPAELAKCLSLLTAEEINAMKRRSLEAAHTLNAEVELQKVLAIYRRLLS